MRLDHRFERGLSNVTATYTLQENGTIEAVNLGLDHERCKWKEASGTAIFLGKKTTASLLVTFFWPFPGGYHVLALDKKITNMRSSRGLLETTSGSWLEIPR